MGFILMSVSSIFIGTDLNIEDLDITGKDEFKFGIPATLEKSGDGKTWVSGIASTDDKDLQGEKINKDAFILDYFLTKGFLNDNHNKDTGSKVGVPTEAKITKDGLWIKGYMLETDAANKIIDLANALNKAGSDRKLGFSVEGKVLERDRKNPNIITKCWLKDVALTVEPINPNTFAEFSKSLAGHDFRDVFVSPVDMLKAKNEEATDADDPDDEDGDGESEEDPKESQIDAIGAKKEGKDKVVMQKDIEEADANRTAVQALNIKDDNEDMDKTMLDVKIAKMPQIRKKSVAKKSLIRKGFILAQSVSGNKRNLDTGDDHFVQHSLYQHKQEPKRLHVLSLEKSFIVSSCTDDDASKFDNHVFSNKKEADTYLKSFGIDHDFSKQHDLSKSFIVAQDGSNACDVCNEGIEKGDPFAIYEGKCFCDDGCLSKALVTGYQFGVTDQAGGGALRVESLEGDLKDTDYAPGLKVKSVEFGSQRANGGSTQITLKDALEFYEKRGIPQDMASRILVLMIKNNGDLAT